MDLPERPIAASYWVLPGRFLAGEYPGSFDEDEAEARIRRFLDAGFNSFIDLTQPHELVPYEPLFLASGASRADYARMPIRDRGIPSPQTMTAILDHIDRSLDAGRQVYLHCWGGVGRTGMTVGCYLVRHGLTGEQALEQIAEWWASSPKRFHYPRSPETDEQVGYILGWKG
ncbi:MAG TPA: hypothetical protein VIU39_13105 [Anaerolineales bacterium]